MIHQRDILTRIIQYLVTYHCEKDILHLYMWIDIYSGEEATTTFYEKRKPSQTAGATDLTVAGGIR